MQFPESWLRTLVNPSLSTQELSHTLTMAGLEVEDIKAFAPPFTGVVVAKIEQVQAHPNADKLRVCQVNDGSQRLQIVCGAPNAREGLIVPLAQVGAVLPSGLQIGHATMRGVESMGMLCSAKELGLSEDHAGLMELNQTYPDADINLGQSLRALLNLDDALFDLKLTPNRADCLSILGVAREVMALTGAPLTLPTYPTVTPTIRDQVHVHIQAPELCGRFMGQVIKGVNANVPTPAWMVSRLERAGQRSVSVLVDISNYVMLERGRPTHVFDLDKLASPALTVRWGKAGESLELLNEQTIQLDEQLGVIDCQGVPESLAGIMGGNSTAVSLQTQNIYVEAAFWWPEAVAGRTRRLKLHSEAAHRFERGVDFESIPNDLNAVVSLIVQICGGQVGPVDDQVVNLPERKPVVMRLSRCQRVLGIDVSLQTVESIFTKLGLGVQVAGDVLTVTPPAYRFDLRIEEDLIEEVARIVGFDTIAAKPPVVPAKMRFTPETQRSVHTIRHHVAALGYQEVVNFSFVQSEWEHKMLEVADPIALLNPIASQMAVMRSMLIPGLLQNVVYNANRQHTRVRVFEAGRVFKRHAQTQSTDLTVKGIDQPLHVAAVAWGSVNPEQWGLKTEPVDYFDVKHDLEVLLADKLHDVRFEPTTLKLFHPGRAARVLYQGHEVGYVGEIHPQWIRALGLPSAAVAFEVDLAVLTQTTLPKPTEIARQPIVQRDVALWVKHDLPVQVLLDAIHTQIQRDPALDVVRRVELFDVWCPSVLQKTDQSHPVSQPDDISLAFRFWLQDPNSTLSDEHVDRCMSAILTMLHTQHAVRQR